jgi:tetratricopeptide (TPR) repeat protein
MIILAAFLMAAAPEASAPADHMPVAAMPDSDCDKHSGAQKTACLAVNRMQTGRFAEAAQQFEAAAGMLKPGDGDADRMLAAAGNMWIAAGQPGKAALALDKALTGSGLLADQRGEALLDRARAAEAQGDLKTARAKVTAAAVTISQDAFLWYFSAALAIRENDPATAKLAIGRALSLEPNDPTVLFEAGHVYEFAGDDAKARDYWTRASNADPKGKSGDAARRALAMMDVPMTISNTVAAQPVQEDEKDGK